MYTMPVAPPPISLAKTTIPTTSLCTSQVLAQVDQKYIACNLESTLGPRTVVLIDQHAADERVSVELIYRELCDGFVKDTLQITELAEQPQVILSREEAKSLALPENLAILQRWGIHLVLPEIKGDYVQVSVKAVPSAFVLRLRRKEAVEMTRLIKMYLPTLGSSMGQLRALIEEGADAGIEWGRVLRWMPKEMIELAKSKACRGTTLPSLLV